MASSEIFFLMVIWKEHYNFKCRTLLCFIIFYIVYSIFQSEFFRKKMINNVIYFKIQKNRIVLQTTKMGLKIILFLYFYNYTVASLIWINEINFLNQLFIVIKRKAFKFYYFKKYKIRRGHIWTKLGPHFASPDLGPIG